MLWGPENAKKFKGRNLDYIIGSDLIYAKEGIKPLVDTFTVLSKELNSKGKHPVVYMAVIRRFAWEQTFFDLMKVVFIEKKVLSDGDISIYRYERRKE